MKEASMGLMLAASLVVCAPVRAQEGPGALEQLRAAVPQAVAQEAGQVPSVPAALVRSQKESAQAECPDGTVLNGRDVEVTLKWDKTGKSTVLKMAYSACIHEFPRGDEELPMQPWTRRVYKTADGSTLGVYSAPERTTSTVSLWLSDDYDAASLVPAFETAKLASGESIDLGEVLLVRADNGAGEAVVHSHMSIRSVVAPAAGK